MAVKVLYQVNVCRSMFRTAVSVAFLSQTIHIRLFLFLTYLLIRNSSATVDNA